MAKRILAVFCAVMVLFAFFALSLTLNVSADVLLSSRIVVEGESYLSEFSQGSTMPDFGPPNSVINDVWNQFLDILGGAGFDVYGWESLETFESSSHPIEINYDWSISPKANLIFVTYQTSWGSPGNTNYVDYSITSSIGSEPVLLGTYNIDQGVNQDLPSGDRYSASIYSVKSDYFRDSVSTSLSGSSPLVVTSGSVYSWNYVYLPIIAPTALTDPQVDDLIGQLDAVLGRLDDIDGTLSDIQGTLSDIQSGIDQDVSQDKGFYDWMMEFLDPSSLEYYHSQGNRYWSFSDGVSYNGDLLPIYNALVNGGFDYYGSLNYSGPSSISQYTQYQFYFKPSNFFVIPLISSTDLPYLYNFVFGIESQTVLQGNSLLSKRVTCIIDGVSYTVTLKLVSFDYVPEEKILYFFRLWPYKLSEPLSIDFPVFKPKVFSTFDQAKLYLYFLGNTLEESLGQLHEDLTGGDYTSEYETEPSGVSDVMSEMEKGKDLMSEQDSLVGDLFQDVSVPDLSVPSSEVEATVRLTGVQDFFTGISRLWTLHPMASTMFSILLGFATFKLIRHFMGG